MDKKFWISGIAALVVTMVLGGLVHGFLLMADYKALGSHMRSEDDQMAHFPYMILAHVFMGFAAAWVYRQGVKPDVPWLSQGVRFGIAIAALMTVPMFLIYYAVQPLPGMLVVKQIIFDTVCWLITGIVLAFINKK
jgi:hypothetical protein